MKTTIKITKEVDIKHCQVKAHVRYWEDAEVNGVIDEDGSLIPCRDGELWCPLIDIDYGIIVNWERGKSAKVHFKVCDSGSYYLIDDEDNIVLSIEDDYVPNNLIPGNYGDYIVMDIDEHGKIKQWKTSADLSDFIEDDEY